MKGSNNTWLGQTFQEKRAQQEEPLVGFRILVQSPVTGLLESPMIKGIHWEPGKTMEAECRPFLSGITGRLATGHLRGAVASNCMCGLYGYRKVIDEGAPGHIEYLTGVTVITLHWGKTQIHPTGFRSEYCKIIGIVMPKNPKIHLETWYNKIFGHLSVPSSHSLLKSLQETPLDYYDKEPLLKNMAKQYNVPLVPVDNAESFAREYGHLISDKEIETWKKEEDDKLIKDHRYALPKMVLTIVLYLFLMFHSLVLPIDLFEWGDGVIDVAEFVGLLVVFIALYVYVRKQATCATERKEVMVKVATQNRKNQEVS